MRDSIMSLAHSESMTRRSQERIPSSPDLDADEPSDGSGYTLDDEPCMWWFWYVLVIESFALNITWSFAKRFLFSLPRRWKDMHENVLAKRYDRMKRSFETIANRTTTNMNTCDENDHTRLLESMDEFNEYLFGAIQGSRERNFEDSLYSTARERRKDRGSALIRDLILNNVVLHFEKAQADRECLLIAKDWLAWEENIGKRASSRCDLEDKLSPASLLRTFLSPQDEAALFEDHHDTPKAAEETMPPTQTPPKSRSSLNMLNRDLLKELIKVNTIGRVPKETWDRYGAGEAWTTSLRDLTTKQHVDVFRAMHKSSSLSRRERLLRMCGGESDQRDTLSTKECILEIHRLWTRAKRLEGLVVRGKDTKELIASVQNDIRRAQHLRDLHRLFSPVNKLADMYLSYASLALNSLETENASNASLDANRTTMRTVHHVPENEDEDDDVFDSVAASHHHMYPEAETLQSSSDDEAVGDVRRETTVYTKQSRHSLLKQERSRGY